MTDQQHNAMPPASELSNGARIRAIADGEIQADIGPDHGAAVAFEHEMRSSVGRAMGGPGAPAGLAERVKAAIAAQNAEFDAEASRFASGVAARSAETRSASFWQRQGRKIGGFAAAAAVLLVAGVYVASVSGVLPGQGQVGGTTYRNQLASFVTSEHDRVAFDERAADRKFNLRETTEARASLAEAFGTEVRVPDCDKVNVGFRGVGPCAVPGTKASRHLQFTVPAAEGSGDADRVVSLFVSSGENTLGLEEGVTYRVDTEACGLPGSRIYMWTAAGLTYCLVTDGEGAGQACDRLIEVLAMPLPTASL